jgi:diaminopimelate epimerase
VGADGIVVLLEREPSDGIFPLRMYNPDGSEFERSGNGLRILAAYLHGEGLVGDAAFEVRSGGSRIPMTVHGTAPGGRLDVSVEMGRARVGGEWVGLDTSRVDPDGRLTHPSAGPITFLPVSVGNPHAVVFLPDATDADLEAIGPFLAAHPAFRDGTNVQLVSEVSPGRIRVRIWERGVGRTSASGTSSCAAAVAAVATGRLEGGEVGVEMDGGRLEVTVGPDLGVRLRGPVEEVARGRLTGGFLELLDPATSAPAS